MKVCQLCGDAYRDHVDFCFNDGEILTASDLAGDIPAQGGVDAPGLPRGGSAYPARSATPVPRANRRSLIRSGGSTYTAPAAPVPAPNAPHDEGGGLGELDDGDQPDDEATVPPLPQSQIATPGLAPAKDELRVAPVPSDVDTAPMPRPQKKSTPNHASPAGAQRVAPPPPVAFGNEEPAEGSGVLMLGIAAALLGMCFVVGAVVVVVGMGSGMFDGDAADGPDTLGLVEPVPVRPNPIPPVPEPDVGLRPDPPTPVTVEPEPDPSGTPDPGTPEPVPAPVAPTVMEAPKPAPPAPPAPQQAAPKPPPKPVPAAPQPPKPPVVSKYKVRFDTDPPGASVVLSRGGTEVARFSTPDQPELAVGKYSYELVLDGFKTENGSLDVTGAPVSLDRKLIPRDPPPAPASPPAKHMVFFEGGSVGFQVRVDGGPALDLPATVILQDGPHTFEVLNPSDASVSLKVTQQVTSDPTKETNKIFLRP